MLHPDHPAFGKIALDGCATAYVCQGMVCSPPIVEPEALVVALRRAACFGEAAGLG
jgi:uncharacterized protein YyaL (SSP411 family)